MLKSEIISSCIEEILNIHIKREESIKLYEETIKINNERITILKDTISILENTIKSKDEIKNIKEENIKKKKKRFILF